MTLESAADLDQLPLRHRQGPGLPIQVEGDPESFEGGRRIASLALSKDDAEAGRLAPECEVLSHRQVRNGAETLVDDPDPKPPRHGDIEVVELEVLPDHPAGIRPQHPAHDLDQCALSGAVLTEQRMDFARSDLKGCTIEGADSTERQGDSGEAKERRPALGLAIGGRDGRSHADPWRPAVSARRRLVANR